MEESRSNTSDALVVMGRGAVSVRGQLQQRNCLCTPWSGEIKKRLSRSPLQILHYR